MINRASSILAASAVFALAATSALAQVRHQNNGRAMDANTRVGSGGFNDRREHRDAVSGNNIVTGNVTGGREFRGSAGYYDEREFRGETAGESSDRFVRGSAGVPVRGAPSNPMLNPQPFYGESRAVRPPEGFREQGNTGGYTPAPAQTRAPGDWRLGAVYDQPQERDRVMGDPGANGQLMLNGPVDANGNPTVITASPLFGVRRITGEGAAGAPSTDPRMGSGSLDRLGLRSADVSRMREELQATSDQPQPEQSGQGAIQDLNQQQQPLSQPMQATLHGGPVAGKVRVEQSDRQRLLVPSSEQSTQYAELNRRYQSQVASNPAVSDEAAARAFQEQLRKKQQATQDQKGLAIVPPTERAAPAEQGEAQQPEPEPAPEPQQQAQHHQPPKVAGQLQPPMRITSLADGVKAQGLADLLRSAEQAMRVGKFADALDRYDAAVQVAPNNPLVMLGRAHAELGAGYFARAEASLTRAIERDPALLMGQYDLGAMMGAARVETVMNDLKKISTDEQKEARPTLLLAYIAHNGGNVQRAQELLNETNARSGGAHKTADTMRRIWQLSGPSGATRDKDRLQAP